MKLFFSGLHGVRRFEEDKFLVKIVRKMLGPRTIYGNLIRVGFESLLLTVEALVVVIGHNYSSSTISH
jgi:hypothetical protein